MTSYRPAQYFKGPWNQPELADWSRWSWCPPEDHATLRTNLNPYICNPISQRERESREIEGLILKMYNLSVRDLEYAILYEQISYRYPNATNALPQPEYSHTTTLACQVPDS